LTGHDVLRRDGFVQFKGCTVGLVMHNASRARDGGLDTIVFDLADVGVRFFTYMSTSRTVVEAAAEQKLELVVLDRPNPISAEHAHGPVLAPGIETFVNCHRLPVMRGSPPASAPSC
jgi:uncharacterized protein YbbC (DUF1343 family)